MALNVSIRRPLGLTLPRRRASHLLIHAVLIGLGFLYLYPLLWVLASSFKTAGEFFSSGLSLIPRSLDFHNYVYAWATGHFSTYFLNTVIIAVGVTTAVILISSMAGYVLAKSDVPGKKLLMGAMVALMFLPGGYTIIPTFDLVHRLGLLNTLWAILLVQTAGALIFNALLFIGYFSTIGKELEEAARVDGCSRLGAAVRVVLPVSVPGLLSLVIFAFTLSMQEFIYALTFVSTSAEKPVTLGITTDLVRGDVYFWGSLMAAALIVGIPVAILYNYFLDHFVAGITGGALK